MIGSAGQQKSAYSYNYAIPPAFGYSRKDSIFAAKTSKNKLDITFKALGYTPIIGTIIGVARVILASHRLRNNPSCTLEDRKLLKQHICRGCGEILSLGIIFLVPDVITAIKARRSAAAFQSFSKNKDKLNKDPETARPAENAAASDATSAAAPSPAASSKPFSHVNSEPAPFSSAYSFQPNPGTTRFNTREEPANSSPASSTRDASSQSTHQHPSYSFPAPPNFMPPSFSSGMRRDPFADFFGFSTAGFTYDPATRSYRSAPQRPSSAAQGASRPAPNPFGMRNDPFAEFFNFTNFSTSRPNPSHNASRPQFNPFFGVAETEPNAPKIPNLIFPEEAKNLKEIYELAKKCETSGDFKALFNLKKECTEEDIHKGYLKLARIIHPDKSEGKSWRHASEELFKVIKEVETFLIDQLSKV